jgi:hypothetical protein
MGPFHRLSPRLAVVMVHNHDMVVMWMRMPVMAVPYDNGFSARNRRRRNGDRNKRRNGTSKLLHRALLLIERMANVTTLSAFPPRRTENSERLFSLRCG